MCSAQHFLQTCNFKEEPWHFLQYNWNLFASCSLLTANWTSPLQNRKVFHRWHRPTLHKQHQSTWWKRISTTSWRTLWAAPAGGSGRSACCSSRSSWPTGSRSSCTCSPLTRLTTGATCPAATLNWRECIHFTSVFVQLNLKIATFTTFFLLLKFHYISCAKRLLSTLCRTEAFIGGELSRVILTYISA